MTVRVSYAGWSPYAVAMSARSPLVTVAQLAAALESEPPPTVLDVRWSLGAPSQRPAYDEGHVPTARWVEFEAALSGEPGEQGRHPMPDRTTFEAAMRAVGVDDDRPVIVYDAANSLAASRLWWLLTAYGHPDVRVLDGGYAAWLAAGGEVSRDEPDPAQGSFRAEDEPAGLIGADGAAEHARHGLLLDARPADRFAGRNETIDPVAGHIPGARSLPALANVDETGHFLPGDDLAMRFTAAGVVPDGPVGVYCGSGVQATHLALALDVAGLHPRTGVYVGSWSHWITDPQRPVEAANG